jgi:putative membrane protein
VTEPGVEDATRRTRLANERTYLAWWRTGLTSIAVGVGIGRLVPAHSSVERWPYELVGAGFGLLGIVFLVAGLRRTRAVEHALDRRTFAPVSVVLLALLVAAGIALAVGVILLIVFGD